MVDEVKYAIGFGPFGEIAHLLFVERTLARIFDYRAETITSIFGAAPSKAAPPRHASRRHERDFAASSRPISRAANPKKRRWLFVSTISSRTRSVCSRARRQGPSASLLVECSAKAARRPYHKQKLALVLTNLRHFALEQASAASRPPRRRLLVAAAVREARHGGRPRPDDARRELRAELAHLAARASLEEIPHEGWLTTREDFADSQGDPPWRMDMFYKARPPPPRRADGRRQAEGRPLQLRHGEPPPVARRASRPDPAHVQPDAITRGCASSSRSGWRIIRHAPPARSAGLGRTTRERVWAWSEGTVSPELRPVRGRDVDRLAEPLSHADLAAPEPAPSPAPRVVR